jgi:hypothetical protein
MPFEYNVARRYCGMKINGSQDYMSPVSGSCIVAFVDVYKSIAVS